MVDNAQDNKDGRLSMRHSVMVWVAGAILGWGVAVVSVYNVVSSDDDVIAENTEPDNKGTILDEAQKMEKIMPAAGQDDVSRQDTTPQN